MPEQETPSSESDETPPSEESTEEKPDEKPDEEVPAEVMRKKLTDANAEAANYRTKLREVEAKLANSKTVEEFETATAELRTQIAALERSNLVGKVAAKHELPDALAARLKGDTEAELEADAKELAKLIAPPAPEALGGGLDPDDGTDDFDPVKAAREARKRRY